MEIIINLDECHSARALDFSQLIHQIALREFKERVNLILSKGRKYQPNNLCILTEHFHETIMLNGSRGSGKTTLVLSIFDMLHMQLEDREHQCVTHGECLEYRTGNKSTTRISTDALKLEGAVLPLGIIDPTLFDHKDIKNRIFLDVVSRIKSVVDDRKRCQKSSYEKKSGEKTNYDVWLEKLQKLAIGLTQLDNTEKNKMWEDPHMLLQEGLKNIKHGRDLELAFHQFVEESKRYLEVDALIVAFDDIDTNFKCGWPVLEVIRKYLTTPHLITVLCGDFELYSKLVRKEQWEMFDTLVTTYEPPQKKHEHEIAGLEDQYLTKILKPLNRIRMYPIQHYIDNGRVVGVINSFLKKPVIITELLIRMCTNVLITTMKRKDDVDVDGDRARVGRYTREVVKLLQTLPVRSLISILNEAILLTYEENVSDDVKSRVLHAITDVFMPTLLHFGYGIDEIRETTTSMALKKLAHNLCRLDMLEDGYKLRGQYWDVDKNKLMLMLGAYYSRYLANNPNGYIDYFILIGLTRELRIQWPLKTTRDLPRSELIKKYINFGGIHSAENSLQTARKFIAFYRSENTRRSISTGTLRLYPEEIQSSNYMPLWHEMFGMANKDAIDQILRDVGYDSNETTETLEERVRIAINDKKRLHNSSMVGLKKLDYNWRFLVKRWKTAKGEFPKDRVFQNYFNTVRTLERAVTSYHRYFITNLVSINMSASGEFLPYISIFNLLGIVSLVLSSQNQEAIKHNIYKYSQIRVYPAYHTGNEPDIDLGVLEWGKYDSQSYIELSNVQKNKIITGLDSFCSILDVWRRKGSTLKSKPVTVDLLARAWSRFYGALNYMDNVLPNNDLMAGNLLHRMIISFLNSILVELELDCEPEYIHINIRQPILRDNVFIENLEVIFGQEFCAGNGVLSSKCSSDNYALFRYLLACPLWGMFLCPRDTKDDEENKVFNIYKRHLHDYLGVKGYDIDKLYAVDYFDSKESFKNLFTPLNSIAVMKRTPAVSTESNIFRLINKNISTIVEMAQWYDTDKLLKDKAAIYNFIDTFIINKIAEVEAPITLSPQEKNQVAAKIRSIISMYVDSDELA